MFITIVIGPMFAGKSSFIFNRINTIKDSSHIAIKPIIDDRYDKNNIVTHDNKKISCVNIDNLLNYYKNNNINEYSNIFIDEAQFFNDLEESVKYLEDIKFKGNLYICGLNGDFKKKPIGKIHNLLCKADELINLKGKCFNCKNKSSFSLKLTPDNSQIDIGGADKYRPVCGKCYQFFEENVSSH